MEKGDELVKREAARDGDDDDEGIDLAAVRAWASYVLRAPRRERRQFVTLLAVGLTVGAAIYVYYPRTYLSEVKILAQRNLVLPALGNPNRAVPRDADNPTKNVGDTILQHDNLVSLIKQVDLVDRWEGTQPPILRAKEHLFERVSGPMSDQDKVDAIEGVLEKRLAVWSDDTTINISAEWPDAQMAYDLASTVEKNFIDARYDTDVNVINDAISILEDHARDEKSGFDAARTDFEAAQRRVPSQKRDVAPTFAAPLARPPVTNAAPIVAPPPPDPVDAQTLKDLERTRASIKQAEDARASRVADINRQINDALVTLAPAHPTVVALKQRLADAQQDTPELLQLRSDERALIDKLAASAASAPPPLQLTPTKPTGAGTFVAPQPLTLPASPLPVDQDPDVTVARMKLQSTAQRYSEIEARIDSAKIELDIARAAHKYRFSIIHPAEVSRKPRKPNPIVLLFGILAGVLAFAFGGVVLRERRKGKLLEEWQVKQTLKLPVLGTLDG